MRICNWNNGDFKQAKTTTRVAKVQSLTSMTDLENSDSAESGWRVSLTSPFIWIVKITDFSHRISQQVDKKLKLSILQNSSWN